MKDVKETEFLPLKETQALLEIGFNEPRIGGFNHDMNGSIGPNMILRQQAFRFFRKEHKMTHFINTHITDGKHSCAVIHDMFRNGNLHPDLVKTGDKVGTAVVFDEYEDAEMACLKKMIALALNKSINK